MSDFESNVPTRKDIMGPAMVMNRPGDEPEMAMYITVPDFAEEITAEVPLCWKCGPMIDGADGIKVRRPILATRCTCKEGR